MYLTTFIFFTCLSCSKSQTVGLDFGQIHVTMTFSLIGSRAVFLAHSSTDAMHNISDAAVFFFRLKRLCIPIVHFLFYLLV